MDRRPDWTLVEGDCMEALRELPDGCATLINTDPPYGIGYQPKDKRHETVLNDERPYLWWLGEAYRVCADPGAIVCWTRWDVEPLWRSAVEAAGFRIRSQVIWDKGNHSMGDCSATFGLQHECAVFATKGRFAFNNERPVTIQAHPRPSSQSRVHPTQKPVSLHLALTRPLTKPGDLVIDPFAGSGSAGAAALRIGRRFWGCEKDPKHAARARAMLESGSQDFTQAQSRFTF